jgi:potassium channel LctB
VRQLLDLGYTDVRLYRGGIAEWKEAGGPIESSAPAANVDSVALPRRPEIERMRGAAATVWRGRQWGNAIVDAIDRRSTSQVFLIWLGIIAGFALLYWITAAIGMGGLRDREVPVGAGLRGIGAAIYFSFVTATSVGYGDVLPVGIMRAAAISEAVSGLLIFGAVIAKFVSRRQEELVREIHRVTFEERLDRVQTNLHLVLSEMQAISAICEADTIPHARVAARFESSSLVFAGELRAIHQLLYQPQRAIDESILGAILASLAASLRTLSELLSCLPERVERSPTLEQALATIAAIAEDICAECVPNTYAPALAVWMDRIQQLARLIV